MSQWFTGAGQLYLLGFCLEPLPPHWRCQGVWSYLNLLGGWEVCVWWWGVVSEEQPKRLLLWILWYRFKMRYQEWHRVSTLCASPLKGVSPKTKTILAFLLCYYYWPINRVAFVSWTKRYQSDSSASVDSIEDHSVCDVKLFYCNTSWHVT